MHWAEKDLNSTRPPGFLRSEAVALSAVSIVVERVSEEGRQCLEIRFRGGGVELSGIATKLELKDLDQTLSQNFS
jgi:hypothetical protein